MPRLTISRSFVLAFVLIAPGLFAEVLPGFRLRQIAPAEGFLTSVAVEPSGRVTWSTRDGTIRRIEGATVSVLAVLPTANEGNAALLGIALEDDGAIIAHTVALDLSAEVLWRVTGEGHASEIARLPCPGSTCPTEHHGGNPIVASDGSAYVGIGDFGGGIGAQNPQSVAGKIFRLDRGGTVEMFALGFRNPYDLASDDHTGTLVVTDNGPIGEDEINVIRRGDNAGWPATVGHQPPVDGMTPPVYVFDTTVAPTGVALNQRSGGALPARSLLVAAYVTHALYFFPSIDARPLEHPVALVRAAEDPMIDVTLDANGRIILGSSTAIYELVPPEPGDVNGDGIVTRDDIDALRLELTDGDGTAPWHAQEGTFIGSWGADVNLDAVIDVQDLDALVRMVGPRRRRAIH